MCSRPCRVFGFMLPLLVVLSTGLLAQVPPPESSPEQPPLPPGTTAPAEQGPTLDSVLANLEQQYSRTRAITSSLFGIGTDDDNLIAVRAATQALWRDGLDELTAITGSESALLTCLQDVADNGVLVTHLAMLARRQPTPSFLREYLRTWCSARIASPYARGKVPTDQVRVARRTGDLVVSKDKLWLDRDLGVQGHANGAIDEGEWFALKLGIVNRSKGTPYLSTSATLVLLDENARTCPLPHPAATPDGTRPPAECRNAALLTDRIPMPELSPGEEATIGPFLVALNPGLKGPYTFRLGLQVEASGGESSFTTMTVSVAAVPRVELSGLTIDDDQTGQSKGNGNGTIEPGEAIELRTRLALRNRKELAKVAVQARQYAPFLKLADRSLGLAKLTEGKPVELTGDFEFTVPRVEEMATVPAEELDSRFFQDRRTILWLAGAGCAGRVKLPRDWGRNAPHRVACPFHAPGYQFVLPVDIDIEFGQLLLISSNPPGATVRINDMVVGETSSAAPLVYTGLAPVKNKIVYYKVTLTREGYQPQTLELPVIWKDRTAKDLSSRLVFDLAPVAAAVPEPPPEPPTLTMLNEPPEPQEPPPPPEPERPAGKAADFKRLGLLGGVTWRAWQPAIDGDVTENEWQQDPSSTVGLELGAHYFFARSFYLAFTGQLHFSVQEPAVAFFGDNAQSSGSVPTAVLAWADSLVGWGLALEPRFRLGLWRLLFDVGMGIQLDGSLGETHQESYDPAVTSQTVTALDQPKAAWVSARMTLGIGVDTGSFVVPYLRSMVLLPPQQGIDWGLAAGVEFQL